jgi:uncharacterized glyoxalase superfamily protein PhnB
MPVNVIPVLVYDDVAEAAVWLCETFGFVERWRPEDHWTELAVANGAVILTEQRAEHDSGPPAPAESAPRSRTHGCHAVLVLIDDVDGHYEHARRRGAPIVEPPSDQPSGERRYTAEDPGGHRWSFVQPLAKSAAEELGSSSSAG